MTKEITLNLDEALIIKAEALSQQTGQSLSQLVADYLQRLPTIHLDNNENSHLVEALQTTQDLLPLTRQLAGCLADKQPSHSSAENQDAYHEHLDEKYSEYYAH
jgi:hypothetical protein